MRLRLNLPFNFKTPRPKLIGVGRFLFDGVTMNTCGARILIVTIISTLLLARAVDAQPSAPDLQWAHSYTNSSNDWGGWCSAQTVDGGFLIAGQATNPNGMSCGLVLRLGADGDSLWSREYTDGPYGYDFYAISAGANGGYLLAGHLSSTAIPASPGVIKIDDAGNRLWSRQFDPIDTYGEFRAMTALADGYALCGILANGRGLGLFVVRTNLTGDTLWTRIVHSGGTFSTDGGYAIAAMADGGFLAAGRSVIWNGSSTASHFFLVRFSAGGDTLWTRIYGEAGCIEEAYSVCATTDGGALVVGKKESLAGSGQGSYLLRVDAGGNRLWERSASQGYSWVAEHMTRTADGNVVVATYSVTSTIQYRVVLTKMTEAGDTLWQGTYPAPAA